jgi:hypothetical protein
MLDFVVDNNLDSVSWSSDSVMQVFVQNLIVNQFVKIFLAFMETEN